MISFIGFVFKFWWVRQKHQDMHNARICKSFATQALKSYLGLVLHSFWIRCTLMTRPLCSSQVDHNKTYIISIPINNIKLKFNTNRHITIISARCWSQQGNVLSTCQCVTRKSTCRPRINVDQQVLQSTSQRMLESQYLITHLAVSMARSTSPK